MSVCLFPNLFHSFPLQIWLLPWISYLSINLFSSVLSCQFVFPSSGSCSWTCFWTLLKWNHTASSLWLAFSPSKLGVWNPSTLLHVIAIHSFHWYILFNWKNIIHLKNLFLLVMGILIVSSFCYKKLCWRDLAVSVQVSWSKPKILQVYRQKWKCCRRLTHLLNYIWWCQIASTVILSNYTLIRHWLRGAIVPCPCIIDYQTLIFAYLVDVKWYLIVTLFHISKWLERLSSLLHVNCWFIFSFLLSKICFAHFFSWIFCFVLIDLQFIIYSEKYLINLYIVNVFP